METREAREKGGRGGGDEGGAEEEGARERCCGFKGTVASVGQGIAGLQEKRGLRARWRTVWGSEWLVQSGARYQEHVTYQVGQSRMRKQERESRREAWRGLMLERDSALLASIASKSLAASLEAEPTILVPPRRRTSN
eukprot:2292930-Rhodomonas_salina.2